MKSIEASVGVIPTQVKKEEVEKEEEEVKEEEYIEHENEMYFFLGERPEYRISAVVGGSKIKKAKWLETQTHISATS